MVKVDQSGSLRSDYMKFIMQSKSDYKIKGLDNLKILISAINKAKS